MTLLGPPLIASESPAKGELLLTDFTSGSPELGWYVVNDNVMGGRSEGDFEQQPGELRFAGQAPCGLICRVILESDYASRAMAAATPGD